MTRAILITCLLAASAFAQSPKEGFGVCKPVSQRTQDLGCWILTDSNVGKLTDTQVYWHLHAYADKASAEAAKTNTGTVVDSLGRHWLLTIAKKDWQPKGKAKQVAVIGPISVSAGKNYSALFMEAIMTPGMQSKVHTHSGPEAWYTQAGETCLETPDGKIMGRPGEPAIVPQGAIMRLTATGKTTRRSIVLILHPSDEKPTTEVQTWQPKGLCAVK